MTVEPSAVSPVRLGTDPEDAPDPGLHEVRAEIARLEAELAEIEAATAGLAAGAGSTTTVRRVSEQLAEEAGAETIERERTEMGRLLESATAVAQARVSEARRDAEAALSARRDEVNRAFEARAAAVAGALDGITPAAPPAADEAPVEAAEPMPAAGAVSSEGVASEDPGASGPGADFFDGAPSAWTSAPRPKRPRARVVSVALWVVGSVLVVFALAFAIAALFAVLD